jgi:Secretion system C-terminal sorting domain
MRISRLFLGIFLAVTSQIHAQTANSLYDIAYKGVPVVIDAELNDWSDAQWLFLSQDRPNRLLIQGTPTSPADFSALFAVKMDETHIYFAVRAKDEGTPMIDTPATPNLGFQYDHLSVYLGLYDIGSRAGSPHTDLPGTFKFIDPIVPGRRISTTRTYRISPTADSLGTALGPDYQLLLRALNYNANPALEPSTYNGGYVDTTITNTTAAGKLTPNEDGYILEWKVPFASLAGKIAKRLRELNNFEWPLFTPAHGKVIVFDADITDLDAGQSTSSNRYLRIADKPALWRDAHSFSMRGRIVDQTQRAIDKPSASYYLDLNSAPNITVDGDLTEWKDIPFAGFTFEAPGGSSTASPADISGYMGMRMDDQNLYIAARVRDEGEARSLGTVTPDQIFTKDHIAAYIGLYNIGGKASDSPSSPHTQTVVSFTNAGNSIPGLSSSYRIKSGIDGQTNTKGADHHIMLRAKDYGATGGAAENYAGGYVRNPLANTTAGSVLSADGKVYTLEWKIPFASLAGNIASGEFAPISWNLYTPTEGHVLPVDMAMGDFDAGETEYPTIRLGNGRRELRTRPSDFSKRAKIVRAGALNTTVATDAQEVPSNQMLQAAFPNPFQAETQIRFALTNAQEVLVKVYDVLGREVATLAQGTFQAGSHELTLDAKGFAAGLYFCELQSNGTKEMIKLSLVK